MARVENATRSKEPGVRSPGISGIPISELNCGQAAKLIGCELTRFPKVGSADEETWRLDFLDPETSSKAHARILITPTNKLVELIVTTSNGQHVNLALDNIQTVDLINYGRQKEVIFRSAESGFLEISDKGCFSGDGLRVLA